MENSHELFLEFSLIFLIERISTAQIQGTLFS